MSTSLSRAALFMLTTDLSALTQLFLVSKLVCEMLLPVLCALKDTERSFYDWEWFYRYYRLLYSSSHNILLQSRFDGTLP